MLYYDDPMNYAIFVSGVKEKQVDVLLVKTRRHAAPGLISGRIWKECKENRQTLKVHIWTNLAQTWCGICHS